MHIKRTYDIQLWDSAANLEILQRHCGRPSKYTQQRDCAGHKVSSIKEEVKSFSEGYPERLMNHPNTSVCDW